MADNLSQNNGLPTSELSIAGSVGTGQNAVPLLRDAIRGAFCTKKAFLLCSPIFIALALSFGPYLPDWYKESFLTLEVRARFIVAVWLAAAIAMSFVFSVNTLFNLLSIARITPKSLCEDNKICNKFWMWLRLSQCLCVILIIVFIVLIMAAFSSRPDTQDWIIVITGIPLVALITMCDYCMYRANRSSNLCSYKTEELSYLKRLHFVLGDSGRMLVYVDVPILIGLFPITFLKLYWIYFGGGLDPIFALGFTGGVIATHLVLGNFISLLFEYLDHAVFCAKER